MSQIFIYVMSSKHRNAESLGEYSPFVAPLPQLDTTASALLNIAHIAHIAEKILPEAAFEFSHGASQEANYLGGGLLYYTLPYMMRAKICVCLGSGGAFVPRLMRQAQRDLGLAAHTRTILVDGDKGTYGRPNWTDEASFLRQHYSDVEIMLMDTADAAISLAAVGQRIDYLHIDADHSLEGSLADFNRYLPLMNPGALVTFHDTRPNAHPAVTCWQAVDYIKALGFEVLNLGQVGNGVAIIKIDR